MEGYEDDMLYMHPMLQRRLAWDPYQHQHEVKIHAILMLLGWGFFIPFSIFALSHLRSQQPGNRTTLKKKEKFAVYFHMVLGFLGLALALGGFGYGVRNFSTLGKTKRTSSPVPRYNRAHGILGCVATGGACLQLILMLCMRPPNEPLDEEDSEGETATAGHEGDDDREQHADPEGDETQTRPLWQQFGHATHRYGGFLWMFFGWIALETGTHIASYEDIEDLAHQNEKYSAAFIGVTAATILATLGTILGTRQFYIRKERERNSMVLDVIHHGTSDKVATEIEKC